MTGSGVQRICRAFRQARERERAALVAYVMCGHPTDLATELVLGALARGGADVIEVGMPHSDPLADGPTIQHAGTMALDGGTTTADCLTAVAAVREQGIDVPILLMGYTNPILAYGIERFCADAAAGGVDGLIIADLPLEEAGDLRTAAAAHGVAVVFMTTPVTPEERTRELAGSGSGFLYCVSSTGTTGARAEIAAGIEATLAQVREISDLPVAVGFGIARPEQVAQLSQHADGVVVGSALVDLLERTAPADRLGALEARVAELVAATGWAARVPG